MVTYEVWIDEELSLTGQVQIGNSSDKPAGIGSLPIGSFVIGDEYSSDATIASLAKNSFFRIDTSYAEGHRVSVRISNNVASEQFKIDALTFYYTLGDVYEE